MWRVLKAMYNNVESSVRVNGERTEWFGVEVGVRQGCVLSPVLFNIFINGLVEAVNELGMGLKFGEAEVSMLQDDNGHQEWRVTMTLSPDTNAEYTVTTHYPELQNSKAAPSHHCTCTCSYFSSTHLPCWHMTAVHMNSQCAPTDDQVMSLHPRWRLRNHPLYKEACKQTFRIPDTSDYECLEGLGGVPTPALPPSTTPVVDLGFIKLSGPEIEAQEVPVTKARAAALQQKNQELIR